MWYIRFDIIYRWALQSQRRHQEPLQRFFTSTASFYLPVLHSSGYHLDRFDDRHTQSWIFISYFNLGKGCSPCLLFHYTTWCCLRHFPLLLPFIHTVQDAPSERSQQYTTSYDFPNRVSLCAHKICAHSLWLLYCITVAGRLFRW